MKKTATLGARFTEAEKERIVKVLKRLKREVSSGVYEAVMARVALWETQADAQELAAAIEASHKNTRRQK